MQYEFYSPIQQTTNYLGIIFPEKNGKYQVLNGSQILHLIIELLKKLNYLCKSLSNDFHLEC